MHRSRFETQVPNSNLRSRGDSGTRPRRPRDATGDQVRCAWPAGTGADATHVGHDLARRARGHAAGRRRRGARRPAADRGAGARRAAAAARRARGCRSRRSSCARRCRGRCAASSASAATTTRMPPSSPASVFKDSDCRTTDAWPIVFTKLPECVVGPHDAVRLPGAASRQPDRLRGRARRRHRPRRPQHRARRARWTTSSATRSSTT